MLIFRVLDGARAVSTQYLVPERSRSAEWMVAFFLLAVVRQAHQPSAMQWSRSEREKMKLPFGSVAERSRSTGCRA